MTTSFKNCLSPQILNCLGGKSPRFDAGNFYSPSLMGLYKLLAISTLFSPSHDDYFPLYVAIFHKMLKGHAYTVCPNKKETRFISEISSLPRKF